MSTPAPATDTALEAELAATRVELAATRADAEEARAYHAANAEVLRVISSSVADTQPVFEKIFDSCQALFAVDELVLGLVHDGLSHLQAWRGEWATSACTAYRPMPVAETGRASDPRTQDRACSRRQRGPDYTSCRLAPGLR